MPLGYANPAPRTHLCPFERDTLAPENLFKNYSGRANGSCRRGRTTSDAATVSFDDVSCADHLRVDGSALTAPYCVCEPSCRGMQQRRKAPPSNIKRRQSILRIAFPVAFLVCLRERLSRPTHVPLPLPGPSALVCLREVLLYLHCTQPPSLPPALPHLFPPCPPACS